MAAPKCQNCSEWSYEHGCKLEQRDYYLFRDCIMGRCNYWHAKRDVPLKTEQERERND